MLRCPKCYDPVSIKREQEIVCCPCGFEGRKETFYLLSLGDKNFPPFQQTKPKEKIIGFEKNKLFAKDGSIIIPSKEE